MSKEVMIVDHDEISSFICERDILRSGVVKKVIRFSDPLKALNWLQNQSPGKLPDLLLLELHLPPMDAWAFLQELEQSSLRLDIYLVSAWFNPEEICQAKAHPLLKGFYLKPLTRKIMQNLLTQQAS